VLSGREACLILEKHGFQKVRQRGSHIIMQRSANGTTTTVPVPDQNQLRVGTSRSIIRQSGVSRTEFEA
jgi:predicted RNA binding protein YcfA (HicA-like mRNA interferase family)